MPLEMYEFKPITPADPPPKRKHRILRSTIILSTLLVLSLLALVFIPVVSSSAITGVANLNAYTESLPPLSIPPLTQHSTIVASDGSLIATLYLDNRTPITLDKVSTNVITALVSTEDRTFYTNSGIDPKGIIRAAVSDATGHPTQGGSTITQQYVKNILEFRQGKSASAGTITRKLNEVIYATQITKTMTKDQILQGYLNTVYFGAGAYGIEAAAERYFSVHASELSLTQAASLVATVRSPTAYNPIINPKDSTAARNRVLTMMEANNKITKSQMLKAQASPLGLKPSIPSSGCASSTQPFFCNWVVGTLATTPELGTTPAQRLARVQDGGLTIKTTLVPNTQAIAQQAATSKVDTSSPIGTAVVIVTPGTGAVTAMATNRVYGLDTAANQTEVNYATSPSPVGSTFKAFTLAAALGQDIPLDTTLPAGSSYHSNSLSNPPGGYFTNAEPSGDYNINIAAATSGSVNTAFVQLEEKVGVLNIASTAHKMGLLSLPLTGANAPSATEGSLTLGARGFSPLEMSSAYATLAAGGKYCEPTGVASITTAKNKVINITPKCSQVISPAVAATETSLLAGVVTSGTGTAAQVYGHPIAGKTGTTTNFGSAWFIGYTPTTTMAVWMGDPRGSSYPLVNVDGVGQVFGGTLPAQMFSQAMTQVLAGQITAPIPPPSNIYLSLTVPTLPDLTNIPASLARTRLLKLGLVPSGIISGVVHSTTPPPGTTIYPGQKVGLGS